MSLLMGIDVGTTGCKVMIFDLSGAVHAKAYRAYPLLMPHPGWREQDSIGVLDAVYTCIRECCENGLGEQVAALSVSAQGEALIPIDRDGNVLDHSIVTFDLRCTEEAEWLKEHVNVDELTGKSGLPLHTMFSLPKLLWIRNHRPEVYEKTWKFLCYADYVAYSLGAEPVMDYSLASRTMLFNIKEGCWDEALCKQVGIDKNKLPEPAPCGTKVGRVSEKAALQVGLKPGTVIAAGGHDQVCCALGAGLFQSKTAMNSMGTTDTLLCLSREFVPFYQKHKVNIAMGSYCIPDLYAAHSVLLTTGNVLKWVKDELFADANLSFDEINREAAQIAGPTGIFLMPHFSGAGMPWMDADSKGVLAGITLETTKAAIFKATMEGICYELRVNILNMEAAGIPIEEIRCVGGGAASDYYLQIKADILKKPIIKLNLTEAGCYGAGLLGGVASGIVTDVEEAVKNIVHIEKVFVPNEENSKQYDQMFSKYQKMYALYKELNS